AEPMLVLKIKSLAKKHGLSPSGKNQMIEELLPFLRKMKGVTRDASISEIASRLAVNENLIRELLDKNSSQQEAIRKTPVRNHISILLRDLIWLSIHHPEEVRPLLDDFNPSLISVNPQILLLLARLMQGVSINDILKDMEAQEEMRRLLLEMVMLNDLYEAEKVTFATKQILLRMELGSLERSLSQKQHDLSLVDIQTDINQYLTLLQELQRLRVQIDEQRRKIKYGTESETTHEGDCNAS
ncbi:MAG: hypothetical protein VX278_21855, partial [Myxococcota bacterium]|nr:hypothetical protein [Myxococcota bacterium]